MQLLAQCRLSIDGLLVEMAHVSGDPASHSEVLTFRFTLRDAAPLHQRVGRIGVVESRSGVVLLRLKLLHVDSDQKHLLGELIRKARPCPTIPAPNALAGSSSSPTMSGSGRP